MVGSVTRKQPTCWSLLMLIGMNLTLAESPFSPDSVRENPPVTNFNGGNWLVFGDQPKDPKNQVWSRIFYAPGSRNSFRIDKLDAKI